jgi:hypothetical protein
MTPANLAGMLKLANIELAALTDHNTTKNCPAFFKACESYGIIPIAGMELTTAEEIHLLCLFPTLSLASNFENEISNRRMKVLNRPDLFGNQLILNENDEIIGSEEFLLSVATNISLEEAVVLVSKNNGVCYPAHVDRESGGIIAILGVIPDTPNFSCVEFRDPSNISEYKCKYQLPHIIISSSDAHFLTGIPDASARIALEGESNDEIRAHLINLLSGK